MLITIGRNLLGRHDLKKDFQNLWDPGQTVIPWCNGQVIQGYEGKGVLVKNDGYVYLQLKDSEIRVIPI